jgi:hypothetical protein
MSVRSQLRLGRKRKMRTFRVVHIAHSRTAETHREVGRLIASRLKGAHLEIDCVWLVHSEEMADEIRDRLSDGVAPEDALLVLEIGEQAAWRGLTQAQGEWIVGHVWVSGQFERGKIIEL